MRKESETERAQKEVEGLEADLAYALLEVEGGKAERAGLLRYVEQLQDDRRMLMKRLWEAEERLRRVEVERAKEIPLALKLKVVCEAFRHYIDCPLEEGCLYENLKGVPCGQCLQEHFEAHAESGYGFIAEAWQKREKS